MLSPDHCSPGAPGWFSHHAFAPTRRSRSSLRVLRHGLAVTEVAVSELPGVPNAVWAVKKSSSGER